jgi:uncharacterized protein
MREPKRFIISGIVIAVAGFILRRTFLGAIIVWLVVVGTANSGPFEDGIAAYKRGDYATALKLFRPLGEQGDAKAQFKIGLMYELGEGVTQDYAESEKWYRRSAEQGVANAQDALGDMYFFGNGVPEDELEAMKWYREAANQGLASAQFSLGLIYENGNSIPPRVGINWPRNRAMQTLSLHSGNRIEMGAVSHRTMY